MEKKYIVAFDQGTTSTRAIIFDKKGSIIAISQKELQQYYPQGLGRTRCECHLQ